MSFKETGLIFYATGDEITKSIGKKAQKGLPLFVNGNPGRDGFNFPEFEYGERPEWFSVAKYKELAERVRTKGVLEAKDAQLALNWVIMLLAELEYAAEEASDILGELE